MSLERGCHSCNFDSSLDTEAIPDDFREAAILAIVRGLSIMEQTQIIKP